MRLDLFCQVVDNFGDAGVCWRLARQLAGEFGIGVRLWIDHLQSLQRIWPAIDPAAPQQTVAGVEIRLWPAEFPAVEPQDVVVEAFGCRLPPSFVAAMAARAPEPLWINLEYLSAETWVEGCHALPSPQPRLPLTKYFFFPGFTERTGGLLREGGLDDRRTISREQGRAALLRRIGVEFPPLQAQQQLVSLFCYENPALPALVSAWADGPDDLVCLVPQGSKPGVLAAFGLGPQRASACVRGRLRALTIPFLDQEDYDRLLWHCDLNFVRGEDSFLRAQWAALPFVWQAYPQDSAAHHAKLAAFLDRYLDGLAGGAAEAARKFFEAWNGVREFDACWLRFAAALPALRRHAIDWDRKLSAKKSLAENLALFCDSKLKSRV